MGGDSRFFDNPHLSSSEPKDIFSYISSVTVPDTAPGFLCLNPESDLAIKLRSASERIIGIIHTTYFTKGRSYDYSVYTGLSGTLYLYSELGKSLEESLIAECVESKSLRKKLGFLGGISGPLAFASIHSTHKDEYLHKLLSLKDSEVFKESPEEFLYGKAGYLFALLLVKNSNHSSELDDAIRQVIGVILTKGGGALRFQWHDKEYFGAAHGYAGILSTLLRARTFLNPSQLDNIRTKINELMSFQFPSGNFPSSRSSSGGDKLVHWCHGAPGFADLYLLSFEVFGDEAYFRVAEKCLEVVWRRGLLKKGFGLCHGTSGNGYTFLLAYKSTKKSEYLYKALRFAEWCSDFENPLCGTPDRPYSLFEGLAGNLFFLTQIQKSVSVSYFPCYTLR